MVDVVLHLIGVGQVIGVQHHAVALSRAAQQVIAGHIIVIRYPDNKVQTALADAISRRLVLHGRSFRRR